MRKFKINEPLCKEYGGLVIIQEQDGKYLWGHKNGYIDAMDLVKLGLFEEVNEPQWSWCVDYSGQVCECYITSIPNWLRFRTKESAEKFAKVLKDTHPCTFHGSCREYYELCEALNDRVK